MAVLEERHAGLRLSLVSAALVARPRVDESGFIGLP